MSANAAEHKYLTFQLDGRTWGLSVRRIQEIIRPLKVLPLPDTPHYVDGLINLRGSVVPLVNLRSRLNRPEVEATDRTAVVVVRLGDQSLAGLLVDSVEQVLHLDQIAKPPSLSPGGTSCVGGIAHLGEEVMTILDIEQVTGGVSVATEASDLNEDWFDTSAATVAAN